MLEVELEDEYKPDFDENDSREDDTVQHITFKDDEKNEQPQDQNSDDEIQIPGFLKKI